MNIQAKQAAHPLGRGAGRLDRAGSVSPSVSDSQIESNSAYVGANPVPARLTGRGASRVAVLLEGASKSCRMPWEWGDAALAAGAALGSAPDSDRGLPEGEMWAPGRESVDRVSNRRR